AWYAASRTPLAADGGIPYARYVIRKKGMVEVGQQSCAMCHTRVMQDGSIVKGAQGNFPFDRAAALRLQRLAAEAQGRERLLQQVHLIMRSSFDAPWLDS